MPWEKQFDANAVLDKATDAFWRHGYKGTSMKCLIEETGLNPGSIYAAFTNKRGLFDKCLDHYVAKFQDKYAELAETQSPRAVILSLFETPADCKLSEADRGCLMVNSALEAGADPEVAAAVRRAMDITEAFIRGRIEAGQAAGEISRDLDPAKAAREIYGMIVAIQVIRRAAPDHPYILEARGKVADLLD